MNIRILPAPLRNGCYERNEKNMMKKAMAMLVLLVLSCTFILSSVNAETAGELTTSADTLIVPVSKMRTIKYKLTPKALSQKGVTFESSDKSIATVDSKGQVKGKAEGECIVTVKSRKDPSVYAELPVRVVVGVKKITAEVENTKIWVGDTVQINCVYSPEEGTLHEAEFSSVNPKVATVDENGLVTAVSRGTATINIKSRDGSARTSVKFTVQVHAESVKFKKDEYNLVAGKSVQLAAKVLPTSASHKRLVWTSSDESVAKVDKTGLVKTKGIGDAVITATSEAEPDVFGSVVVHSVNPIKSLRFQKNVYDTGVGAQIQLEPVIEPADASHTKLKYTARNRQVCTVDENGLVTTLHGGITTVTATTTDGTNRTAEVTVRSIVPVEGAYFEQKSVRVDLGNHTFAYAKLLPLDATVKDMVWESSDPEIASVSGTDNRVRIVGNKWGRCIITGTTEQGGYEASLAVNVGALRAPLTVKSLKKVEGMPIITLKNESDMHMTGVTFAVRSSKGSEDPIEMDVDLAAGEEIALEAEVLKNYSEPGVAVSYWKTDSGFYTNEDELLYEYRISPGLQVWEY